MNNNSEQMTPYQLSRWLSLFEAVNILADSAEDKGINLNFMRIKKLPIDHYIKNTSCLIYREIVENKKKHKEII